MGQPSEHRILEATCEVMQRVVTTNLGPGGNTPVRSTDYFMAYEAWKMEMSPRLSQEWRDALAEGVRANLFKLGFGW